MNVFWLSAPLFKLGGHHFTLLGIGAFVGLMALGFLFAKVVQSAFVRRLLRRFKLDANFVAIITTIVPKQKFIDSPVINWTYGDPKVRFRIPVGVAYGSDVEKCARSWPKRRRKTRTPWRIRRQVFSLSNSGTARSTSSWSPGATR